MKTKVFIDGHEGTTGLRIHERLQERDDITLVPIAEDKRKDPDAIRACMKEADIAFLCLPDQAAIEAVELAKDCDVRIIDTSTAHRTADGWVYGFPELAEEQPKLIRESNRVANPGCHATGVIALIEPLIQMGVMGADYPVSAVSITGYSGGGKKMIAQYESNPLPTELLAPRQYGLSQKHKHLPEIVANTGLDYEPNFSPVVANYYSGMEVMIPIVTAYLSGDADADTIWQVLYCHYEDSQFVHVLPFGEDKGGFIAANAMSGFDDMQILVTGNEKRVAVTALFDNLGKGASGAAIQNMNIMLGLDPATGLTLSK